MVRWEGSYFCVCVCFAKGAADAQGLGEEGYSGAVQQQYDSTVDSMMGGTEGNGWQSQQGEPAQAAVGDNGGAAATQEVTFELIQQWAQYYASQGSTEEQLRTWVATEYPAFAGYDLQLSSGWEGQPQDNGLTTEAGEQEERQQGLESGYTAEDGQWEQHPDAVMEDKAAAEVHNSTPADNASTAHTQTSLNEQEEFGKDSAQGGSTRRHLAEIQSNAADYGSSKGHMDDVSSIGTVRVLLDRLIGRVSGLARSISAPVVWCCCRLAMRAARRRSAGPRTRAPAS